MVATEEVLVAGAADVRVAWRVTAARRLHRQDAVEVDPEVVRAVDLREGLVHPRRGVDVPLRLAVPDGDRVVDRPVVTTRIRSEKGVEIAGNWSRKQLAWEIACELTSRGRRRRLHNLLHTTSQRNHTDNHESSRKKGLEIASKRRAGERTPG